MKMKIVLIVAIKLFILMSVYSYENNNCCNKDVALEKASKKFKRMKRHRCFDDFKVTVYDYKEYYVVEFVDSVGRSLTNILKAGGGGGYMKLNKENCKFIEIKLFQ